MNITSAQYTRNIEDTENENIKATIDGQEMFVPMSEGNRHWDEIKERVDAGELTIEDAD